MLCYVVLCCVVLCCVVLCCVVLCCVVLCCVVLCCVVSCCAVLCGVVCRTILLCCVLLLFSLEGHRLCSMVLNRPLWNPPWPPNCMPLLCNASMHRHSVITLCRQQMAWARGCGLDVPSAR